MKRPSTKKLREGLPAPEAPASLARLMYVLLTTDYRLLTTYYLLLTTDYRLLTTYYLLLTTDC